jgi:hypothetical protein
MIKSGANKVSAVIGCLLLIAVIGLLSPRPINEPSSTKVTQSKRSHLTNKKAAPKIDSRLLGNISVPFIENTGQLDSKVKFHAQLFDGALHVTETELVYSLPNLKGASDERIARKPNSSSEKLAQRSATPSQLLVERFVNADYKALSPKKGKPSGTTVSTFLGSDKSKWRNGVATYESVSLGEPWKGVSVDLKAYAKNVEKLFTVAPHTDPSVIALTFAEMQELKQDEKSGELVVKTIGGEVRFTKPYAYQLKDGIKEEVQAAYNIRGKEYGFSVGAYDRSAPLIIDPLIASTIFGGSLISMRVQ